MEAIRARHFVYPFPVMLLAYFVGGGAYSLFFGGDWTDGVCGGLCGVAIGLCLRLLAPLGANSFVRTIAAGAVAALCALVLVGMGLGHNPGLYYHRRADDPGAGDRLHQCHAGYHGR